MGFTLEDKQAFFGIKSEHELLEDFLKGKGVKWFEGRTLSAVYDDFCNLRNLRGVTGNTITENELKEAILKKCKDLRTDIIFK